MTSTHYETSDPTPRRSVVARNISEELQLLIDPDPSTRQPRRATGPSQESTDPTTQPTLERLLTAQELATMHENYIYDLAARGQIPSYKIGGNRRFRLSEIEDWLDQQRSGTYTPSIGAQGRWPTSNHEP